MFDMEYDSIEVSCLGRNKRYSKDVLIGCWFDQRVAAEEDEQLMLKYGGRKPCEHHLSIYKSHFQKANTRRDAADDYKATRLKAFGNSLKSNHSHIQFFDHKQYMNNMATTHDVGYRIMPDFKRVTNKNPTPKYGFDYSKALGNVTTTGKRQHVMRDIAEDSLEGVPYSVYQISYKFKDQKC